MERLHFFLWLSPALDWRSKPSLPNARHLTPQAVNYSG